jgi:hypothetical protein
LLEKQETQMMIYSNMKISRQWGKIRSLFFIGTLIVLTACVGSPTFQGSPDLINIADIDNIEAAERAWKDSQVNKYHAIWLLESVNGSAFEASKAAYELALATDDPSWSKASIEKAEKALQEQTGSPERSLGLLGASHRMAARNFPIQGFATYALMGIPGWIQLFHIHAAVSNLNQAVQYAPDDPEIRLYRASAYCGIPTLFGVRDTCYEDYAQLQHWVDEPTSNESFEELLLSASWLEIYYVLRAQSMEQLNDKDEARLAWRLVRVKTQNPYLRLLSEFRVGKH